MVTASGTALVTRAEFNVKSASRLFRSPEKLRVALSLVLVLAALLLYGPVIHNGFINVDDNGYIVDNAHVHRGLTLATLRWALSTLECENWHPLTWASHALDWQLFGPHAAGHHYVSAILHALNVMLLFLLFESATGFTWRSLFVAALFAVHPVNVESVAWAAERKNLLSMMFFLLAMIAYGRYAKRPCFGRYASVLLLYALALMGKPQVVTFPMVLVLWDYWPLERFGEGRNIASQRFDRAPFWRLALEKLPLLFLSAADVWLTMLAQQNARLYARAYPLPARLGNALTAYVRYLGHAIWPVHLAPAYSHTAGRLPLWSIVASGAFLLVASFLARRLRRRYLLVGWLWFLGVLVPMIGLVQVGDQAMADRYAYIPFIGLFVMAAWMTAEAADIWRVSRRAIAAAASLVIVALALLTSRQITYWHDSERLWRYALSVTHDNFIAHSYLAAVLTKENRHEEAIQEYLAAERLHSYPLTQVVYFADYELRHGHRSGAMAEAEKVLQGTTDPAAREMAYRDLAIGYTQMAKPREARENYEQALSIEPRDPYAFLGLGLLAYRESDFSQAADYFSRAARVDPSDFDFLLLGRALERAGRQAESMAAYAQAQRVSRDYGEAEKKALWFLTN
ncbi:MAG: tetratricopeptide repeat protein [Acidobacteria bacterium]|nr:tetratricopeptide repeat protein [Acidobacteriota bacterium]